MSHTLNSEAIGERHFEHSVDLLCVVGSEGQLRRVNDAWFQVLGWPAADLDGVPLSSLIHPDDLRLSTAAHERLCGGEPVAGLRLRMRHRAGGWRWFEWSAACDAAHDLCHAVGRDVDLRVAAERAIERERRQLEEAQSHARVGSWDWEIETGLRYWSPQHYRNHGFEPSDLAPDPMRLLERVHPDDRERVAEVMGGFHANPRPTTVEYRVVLPDDGVRIIENRCYGIEVEDGVCRVVGTSRDLTVERNAEQLKDEFFGLVAHELRKPLTSIVGYAELLRDFEWEGLSEQGRRFLGVIERNSRRELGLVRVLLTLSRIESGTFRIDPTPTEIDLLAEAAVNDALPHAADAGIQLELVAERVPVTAADAERITELLDNLISNALKFTERGGRVTVRVLGAEDSIAIEVSDTGIGIPPGEQAQIFDRLFRADFAEELHIPGSGVGLTIVKAIVDAHEASISLRSEPGEGTTFRVELPVRGPEEHHADATVRVWQPAA